MLQTKFRGNRPAGLPYMGMAAILVTCPASYQQILISMYLKAYIQNLVKKGPVALIGQAVSEKKMFEILDDNI